MLEAFRHIRLQDTADVDYVFTPELADSRTTLNSPAIDVFTDFHQVRPVTVSESISVQEALEYMKSQHVRLLFAIDSHDNFTGIVTSADILGRKVMAFMQKDGISREQVQVRHIMLGKLSIRALTYDQLVDARVGDVMLTLKNSGDQHVVVVEQNREGNSGIRGIISASDISRCLRIGFNVMYEAKSFADIEKVIAGDGEM
ncbi:CBS domain-containing protein [Neptuniibacter halophilus]|uniref:CBS domain-containing protein n=1 Tax=Neptuniibacter halophilus TaxID=651666 RepID=UPI002572D81B|nr:CBS domain-containing protein [Neptuniibacter halophilus]